MSQFQQFISFLCFSIASSAFASCPADLSCSSTEIASGFVDQFCIEQNGKMLDRCCTSSEKNGSVIGLDLRNCSLTTLNITDIAHDEVEIIDLRDNALEKVKTKQFWGFVNLNILYLPFDSNCPGGLKAWNHTDKNPNTSYIECSSQLNPCQYLNVSCTINGLCVHMGPGSAKCICKPGHHGYKCLQQGKFPTLTVILGMCIPTVVVSALSWYFLRKNIPASNKVE